MGYGRKLLRALLGASLTISVLTVATTARADEPLTGNKPCSTVAPQPGATKFLITGDSIVHQSRGDYTWRYFLYKQLVAAGVNADFVGDYNWLVDSNKSDWPYCDYNDPNFDTDHTSYPGTWLADYNESSSGTGNLPWIRYEVATHSADVVVSIAGANDIARSAGAQATVNAAQTYVTNARAANPNVKIVLSTVPTGGPYDNKPNAQYNALLLAQAPGWSTANSPVVVADIMQNWGTATNTWDQIHPNVFGDQLIAKGLADKLSSLGIGQPGVPVNPDFKNGIRKPVTNFTATLNGSTVNLAWALPIGASGVQVMARDTTNGVVGDWFVAKDLTWFPGDIFGVGACKQSTPCTSYALTTLTAGHTYDVDLHSEKGFSVATDLWGVKPGEDPATASLTDAAYSFTMPGTAPTPPAAPVLAAPVAGAGSVSLSWPAVAGANQPYNVRWRIAGAGSFSTSTATGTTKTVTGLTPGQSYGFQVQAVKDGLTGAWSSEQLATPKPAAPVLNTPTTGAGTVSLTWAAVSGANQPYNVRWRVAGSGTYNTDTVNATSTSITGLTPGQSYGFQVQAVADGTASDWSAEKTAAPRPSAPVISTVVPAAHAAKVTWSAVPDASSYRIGWRTGSAAFTFSSFAAGTSRSVSGLTPGAKYEFVVQAQAGTAVSASSASKFAVPKFNVLGTQAKPVLKALSGQKVRVTWSACTGASRYLLQFRLAGGAWKNVKFFTLRTYSSPKLIKGKTYEFRVTPYDGTLAGKASTPSRITIK